MGQAAVGSSQRLTCAEGGCTEPKRARGLCGRHYAQRKRAGTLPPLEVPVCNAAGCFKTLSNTSSVTSGLCRKHFLAEVLPTLKTWEERILYPTKPWLPVEGSHTGVVHVETWLRWRGGGTTLVAACMSSLLVEKRAVQTPTRCGKCLKILRDHGLVT